MTVYVDQSKNSYGRMLMSHMLADTLPELHAMADKIGVNRRWFQANNIPHYDICQSKRALALRYGAEEIYGQDLGNLIKRIRISAPIRSTIE